MNRFDDFDCNVNCEEIYREEYSQYLREIEEERERAQSYFDCMRTEDLF